MAKQRRGRSEPSPAPDRPAVTADRFARLYRLVQLLAKTGQSREILARRLGVDVRGFYRDLDLLRKAGITVTLTDSRYTLTDDFDLAMSRLPFPDPHLTLGEARTLAKGRGKVQQQLLAQINQVLPG